MVSREKVVEAQQCLAENGVDPSETAIVLQAIGYLLLDEELEDYLDWDFEMK